MVINAPAQNSDSEKILTGRSDTLQNTWFLNRLQLQFDQRRSELKKSLVSEEKLLGRRDQNRKWMAEKVGDLPAKTPLNPVFSGKTDLGTYTIEKVVFESKPNHHITGLFYLPKTGKSPIPAVYIPCGHTKEGKAYADYQKAARLFALNGFAVLQADPICQNERLQYLDQSGKAITREGTYLHEIFGHALLLTGSNTLVEELQDNIRCLDFLEQQPSVDKNKIAVAGHSGGGTQTTYLTAFDRRVKVATPVCYIATSEEKFKTIGTQDGCQQMWGEGKAGIEEQDFLFMAAPVPIRILATEQDFFSFDGAKKAFEELKRMFTVLKIPEKADMVSCPGEHGWHKPLREASVQWCKQWLMNDPAPVSEPLDIGFFGEKSQVTVCPTGQVMTSFPGERSVIDLNREKLKKCDLNRLKFQQSHSSAEIIAKIKALTGFTNPGQCRVEEIGSILENGVQVKKLLIIRDENLEFKLPALLYIPDGNAKKRPATILISQDGKSAEQTKAEIQKELKANHIVLAVDVCNTGELADKRRIDSNNCEFWIAKLPLYEGKTLMTYRIEDLLVAANYLKNLKLVNNHEIGLISIGYTGPATLHAAALGQCFNHVKLIGSLASWRDVANAYHSKNQLANVVPGALNYYDLPDLVKLASKTKVEIVSPVNAEEKQKD
jgi:cephalosporin-C deacetylase-like acetyl esterase